MLAEARNTFAGWVKKTHWRRLWSNTGQLQEVAMDAFLGTWEVVQALGEGQVDAAFIKAQRERLAGLRETYDKRLRVAPMARANLTRLDERSFTVWWARWAMECFGDAIELAGQQMGKQGATWGRRGTAKE